MSLGTISKHFFSTSWDGDSAASLGSLFRCLITLFDEESSFVFSLFFLSPYASILVDISLNHISWKRVVKKLNFVGVVCNFLPNHFAQHCFLLFIPGTLKLSLYYNYYYLIFLKTAYFSQTYFLSFVVLLWLMATDLKQGLNSRGLNSVKHYKYS